MKAWVAGFFAGCLCFSGCAELRQAPVTTQSVDSVFVAEGMTKDSIYDGAKAWMAEKFKSSKTGIETEELGGGRGDGKGSMRYPPYAGLGHLVKANWKVLFTMRVDVRDEKFRLTFSDLQLAWQASYNTLSGMQPANRGSPLAAQNDLDLVRPALLAFGEEIKASLTRQKASSDW